MRALPSGLPLRERLLNEGQRGFPLVERPFLALAKRWDSAETKVLQACAEELARGAISRIGGVWAPGVGGAALLCAMAVPPERLHAVAARVSAHLGVNHNYEREHRLNLWFVITGTGAEPLDQALASIEVETSLPVTRLKMLRPYRIDLGFDLRRPAVPGRAILHPPPRVDAADHRLAALVEAGLPLVPEPFAEWSAALQTPTPALLSRIRAWLDSGTLRRFGLVVRHHEVGFSANAMTVFDVDDTRVDAYGERLATQAGITLCYRRERAEGWRYNLYCMVHGRSRDETLALLHAAIDGAGLAGHAHQILFSRQRFKQTGARYFRPSQEAPHAA